MTKIKAVSKRLIVKQVADDKSEEKKGIIIPGDDRKPFKAQIIAVGVEVDCHVNAGEYVLLPFMTGTPIEIDGQKFLVIFEDQILAVIDK
jgi:chaperonin GroES